MILREKQGSKVRVTFRLPSTIWADSVHLVGDFNDWSRTSHPLRRTRDGEWEISMLLDEGRTYQFRYLVNGSEWQNDWNADRYVSNPFGGENSLIET
jgi:1,4-alpha-glucan branching enzyme